jgi:hypothetical protein
LKASSLYANQCKHSKRPVMIVTWRVPSENVSCQDNELMSQQRTFSHFSLPEVINNLGLECSSVDVFFQCCRFVFRQAQTAG